VARYFVSRHAVAQELARRWALDCVLIDHLEAAVLRHGDEVIGTLPVNLAATSLARLWRNQGRHADTTALIHPSTAVSPKASKRVICKPRRPFLTLRDELKDPAAG